VKSQTWKFFKASMLYHLFRSIKKYISKLQITPTVTQL
jgi:hypothetical protein